MRSTHYLLKLWNSSIWLARAVGPIFKRQGKGNFIATSSISGIVVNQPDTQALYNTSKAGLIHFVKSLAYDWKDFARCNVVCPGYFNTAMGCETEEEAKANRYMCVMARMGDPKELKGIYLYLASDACKSFSLSASLTGQSSSHVHNGKRNCSRRRLHVLLSPVTSSVLT